MFKKYEVKIFIKVLNSISSSTTIDHVEFLNKYINIAIKNKYIINERFINKLNRLLRLKKHQILKSKF
ncbi:MAG: hypothetical protein ACOCP4_00650 [Candidatus Woesearchaeota archaeon]